MSDARESGRVRHGRDTTMKARTKRQSGAKVQARAKPGKRKPNTKASAARRQLWQLCEQIEVMLLAMEKVAGGVLAFELAAISDQLHEAVGAG